MSTVVRAVSQLGGKGGEGGGGEGEVRALFMQVFCVCVRAYAIMHIYVQMALTVQQCSPYSNSIDKTMAK